MSISKKYKIGGYVKRAKLNLRNADDVKAFHRGLFERLFMGYEYGELVDVYIDITGYKETAKRPEMSIYTSTNSPYSYPINNRSKSPL